MSKKTEKMHTRGENEHALPPVASHDTPASFFRHSHSFNTFSYTTNLIHLKLKVQK